MAGRGGTGAFDTTISKSLSPCDDPQGVARAEFSARETSISMLTSIVAYAHQHRVGSSPGPRKT